MNQLTGMNIAKWKRREQKAVYSIFFKDFYIMVVVINIVSFVRCKFFIILHGTFNMHVKFVKGSFR